IEIYVGGGITSKSIPEKEWEETVAKTMTMRRVLA
ncbi:MAG: chorismate-binding protein, partial [Lutimonas sp.]